MASSLPPSEEKKLLAMMAGGDKFPFIEELKQNEKGELVLPKDIGDRLKFMESRMVHPDYKRFRHVVVHTFALMGLPIMETMRRLNVTERTLYRWRKEARDYFKDLFTNTDVTEIHANRMARITIMQERLWQVLVRQNISPHEVATIVASMVGVDKLEDRILKQAGYYEIFGLGTAGKADAESKAEDFRRDLDAAFMDDTPLLIEDSPGNDDVDNLDDDEDADT